MNRRCGIERGVKRLKRGKGNEEPGIIDVRSARDADVDRLLEELSANRDGLTSGQAAERLERYGPNEIPEKKVSLLRKLLHYFWGPIPWMIEAATLISLVDRQWEDFFIILALLLLNALVGFWQEKKADDALELLKERLALDARVLRDAGWRVVQARELVPGDVVRVRPGDIVPADIKLFRGTPLQIDESALTGESLPVNKEPGEVTYAGSIVKQGEMDALVLATGSHTFFGKTAQLVEDAKTQSHFQKAVIKIGNFLIVLAIVLGIAVFVAAVIRHDTFSSTLQFVLVLTVAAIPAALPAVLSVTMAVGANALSKKEAIVSRLVAIEELAGMDVLCSDKTGTITRNELTIAEVDPIDGFSEDEVILFGALASREENRDPIDTAVIEAAKARGILGDNGNSYKVIDFQPFDPVVKRTVAVVEDSRDRSFRVSKGAPQAICALCDETEDENPALNSCLEAFASRGYRTLCVAKSDNGAWTNVGTIAISDPPYEDSAQTIKTAQSLGVEVKMITGDHEAIAREIASQVNLGDNVITPESYMGRFDLTTEGRLEQANVLARVLPEHKYHAVELLQDRGHIVGMTGDGVNDAPALKKADAGIAVAGATDAARSAADVILTVPGLSVIIDAIKESRKVFRRMNNYAIYRIAETIRVLFFIAATVIAFNAYPVTAVMIVMLAVLNDIPIMAIAFDNVPVSDSPERWEMGSVLGMASFLGFFGVVTSFLIYFLGRDVMHLSPGVLQSLIFLKLAIAGHLTIFLARTRGPFWSSRPSGALFWSALLTKIIATLIAVYGLFITPLGWKLALLAWGYALVCFMISDLLKVRIYRLIDRRASEILPTGKSAREAA
jgi:H+-transporting ATPase